MSLKLKRTMTAGLASLACLGLNDANANLTMKVGPVDANDNFYTNVVKGMDFKMGVYVDGTTEPTKGISAINWDVFFGSLTNYVTLNSAELPNHDSLQDFFKGFTMVTSGLNAERVDGTLSATSYADDNVRDVVGLYTGPTNNTGFLGFYNCTANNLMTNKQATLMNTHAYDTTGAAVGITPTNLRFNVVAIPEPGTLGLLGLIGAGALAVRRFRRDGLFAPNKNHSRDTGRKYY